MLLRSPLGVGAPQELGSVLLKSRSQGWLLPGAAISHHPHLTRHPQNHNPNPFLQHYYEPLLMLHENQENEFLHSPCAQCATPHHSPVGCT